MDNHYSVLFSSLCWCLIFGLFKIPGSPFKLGVWWSKGWHVIEYLYCWRKKIGCSLLHVSVRMQDVPHWTHFLSRVQVMLHIFIHSDWKQQIQPYRRPRHLKLDLYFWADSTLQPDAHLQKCNYTLQWRRRVYGRLELGVIKVMLLWNKTDYVLCYM